MREVLQKIIDGHTPRLSFEETYELRKELVSAGLLKEEGAKRSMVAQITFSYIVNHNTIHGTESYLTAWKKGKIAPEQKLIKKG